jgi:hypothetical protein
MQRFKSLDQAQHFLSAQHLSTATSIHADTSWATAYRTVRSEAFRVWKQETCVRSAA